MVDSLVSLTLETDAPTSPGAHARAGRARARWRARGTAFIEVVICSGFPSQLLLSTLIASAGVPALVDGTLSARFVLTLSLLDALVVLGLIFALLWWHGESPRTLFLGARPVGSEALLGLLLVGPALGFAAVTSAILRQAAPWLHDVPQNPLEGLIRTPAAAAGFAAVAVVAGGLREELQRAFVLNRFERHLGGALVGLVIFSVAFGAGHLVQGRDVAVVTGLLGASWGALYLWRRSVVSAVVSHAGFNLAEIARHLLTVAGAPTS